jgi:hypothetical protein
MDNEKEDQRLNEGASKFISDHNAKCAAYADIPESASLLFAEFAKQCMRINVKNIAKQLICRHEKAVGGNDYILCNECGLEWDYTKTDPVTALKMFNHPITTASLDLACEGSSK